MSVLERDGPSRPVQREMLPSFSEIMSNTFAAGVSFRRYGTNGELKRNIIHRFPAKKLKCESSVVHLMAENITRGNSLLDELKKRK